MTLMGSVKARKSKVVCVRVCVRVCVCVHACMPWVDVTEFDKARLDTQPYNHTHYPIAVSSN